MKNLNSLNIFGRMDFIFVYFGMNAQDEYICMNTFVCMNVLYAQAMNY
jgi:hypothetical protein